jgi:S-adenosylmethionine:tRNA ribosyltransferase-isomerase
MVLNQTPGMPFQPEVQFVLPPELEAHEPPEYRGLRRDQVRMMVIPRYEGAPIHDRFDALGDYLKSGDLLVANKSRTLPGLLRARDQRGEAVEVRLAQRRSERRWDALLLDGRTHIGKQGMLLDFGQDLLARVDERRRDLPFLWRLQFNRCCLDLLDHIYRLGEPVRYTYVKDALPIDLYQTVYASEPGSVEMPSAGRAFTWELLLKLKWQGIGFASLLLHTGLSSTRDDQVDATHPNYDEEFEVSESTARVVNETRMRGGRVIAVGTTVVRALETVARADGTVRAGEGRTRLLIDSKYMLKAVDGLVTGLHEPKASHLHLLSAIVEPLRLQLAYLEAIDKGYLWHEFGDMNLIM